MSPVGLGVVVRVWQPKLMPGFLVAGRIGRSEILRERVLDHPRLESMSAYDRARPR